MNEPQKCSLNENEVGEEWVYNLKIVYDLYQDIG